jgi:hypothetical protein
MSHSISAAIVRGETDGEVVRELDVKLVPFTPELKLVALEAGYCDHWAAKLDLPGLVAEEPLLNTRFVHYLLDKASPGSRFALIETEYCGGLGEQAAAVYEGGECLMAPERAEGGPINRALRLLGVQARPGRDEFDTVELVRFRSFGNLFRDY